MKRSKGKKSSGRYVPKTIEALPRGRHCSVCDRCIGDFAPWFAFHCGNCSESNEPMPDGNVLSLDFAYTHTYDMHGRDIRTRHTVAKNERLDNWFEINFCSRKCFDRFWDGIFRKLKIDAQTEWRTMKKRLTPSRQYRRFEKQYSSEKKRS